MHISLLLQMAADGMQDRIALGSVEGGITMRGLAERSARAAALFESRPGARVAMIDVNSEAVPIALFGASLAGKPFVPINYRLSDEQLQAIVRRTAPAVMIVGGGVAQRLGQIEGIDLIERGELLTLCRDLDAPMAQLSPGDPDDIAVLLYTSGTTGEPKAAVLRHRNLAAYILTTVAFAGCDPDEAAIVSVPSYHIAGVSAVLSSTYGGRRLVYAEAFEPRQWVEQVRQERITHAMVVPTMLNRILDVIEADGSGLPSLRMLSYGGGPMPTSVVERAVRLLSHVDFVNAYGLTETSSTIALLGPADHREAFASADPGVRSRLGSVGRPLDTVELSIRDTEGAPVPTGQHGEIWVRGEQVSGEYLGGGGALDDGWFCTRDAGHLDDGGFLYIHGRLDDVIVRGGENLSPGEIEAVLLEHPAVEATAVVGIPDTDWGEKVVAAVVLHAGASASEGDLRQFVQTRLRSTKTPERIDIRADLPFSDTGKLLRRMLRVELEQRFSKG